MCEKRIINFKLRYLLWLMQEKGFLNPCEALLLVCTSPLLPSFDGLWLFWLQWNCKDLLEQNLIKHFGWLTPQLSWFKFCLLFLFHWRQAAIGSKALDMAREIQDETLQMYGLDVLTLAVLAILTTAPVGALGIGLAGPRLLVRQVDGQSLGPSNTYRESA